MKKILFSPIGGTDPISNFRDGAMLHICRIYKPDIVYLYLSKEMCEFQEKDDRYRYCLEQLGKKLDKHFEVIEIQKNELEEVQVFDTFMKEYREILNDIRDKNPESEIILNVSSGTPAMKSALQILAAMGEIHMQAIQVSTPKKKINPHEEDRDDYDVEGYWELNEDNDEELFVNRCKESEHFYLLDEVRKETIIKHIKAYDYVAALQIAGEMTEPFDDETMALLKAANSRLQLNIGEIDNLLKPYNISIIPVRIEQQQKIFEYLLNSSSSLSIKAFKGFNEIFPLESFKERKDNLLFIVWFCTISKIPAYTFPLLALIKPQIRPSWFKLCAKASKDETPNVGMFLLSENALAVAIPILTPVKEPGPRQQLIKFISSNDMFDFLKASSIIGINF